MSTPTKPQGKAKRNTQATASLILGVLSIVLALATFLSCVGAVAALLALVTGVRGIRAARQLDGQGHKLAIAGMASSGLGLFLFIGRFIPGFPGPQGGLVGDVLFLLVLAAVPIAIIIWIIWLAMTLKARWKAERLKRPSMKRARYYFRLTLIPLAVIVVGIVPLIREYQWRDRLEREGVPAQATILRHREYHGDESSTYYVTYRYSAPMPYGSRQTFTKEASVGQGIWYSLKDGEEVTIVYAASDPRLSALEGDLAGGMGYTLFVSAFFGLPFLLWAVWLISNGVWTWRAARRRGR